jgi:hypothetical protein
MEMGMMEGGTPEQRERFHAKCRTEREHTQYLIEQAKAEERERCAKICEALANLAEDVAGRAAQLQQHGRSSVVFSQAAALRLAVIKIRGKEK